MRTRSSARSHRASRVSTPAIPPPAMTTCVGMWPSSWARAHRSSVVLRGLLWDGHDDRAAARADASGMTDPLRRSSLRVVIAGGGVAALETLLALRVLGGLRTAITLLAPQPDFLLRAATVGEPFELA